MSGFVQIVEATIYITILYVQYVPLTKSKHISDREPNPIVREDAIWTMISGV